MDKFRKLFTKKTSIIGMIHLDPLPAAPSYKNGSFNNVVQKARHEANVYIQNKIVKYKT
jgi:predicted TIM-barrel enzyme